MRVLYLHQYFRKPEQGGALRSYYLAQALVAAGHTVEMITAHNEPEYRHELVDGISVHYLPVPYDNAFEAPGRLKAFWQFTWKSLRLSMKLSRPDLCYATSTPLTVGITALVLKRFRKIPFYFEVRDLWPEAPIQLGYLRHPKLIRLMRKLERSIYRQADKVIALSPGMLAGIRPHKPSWALHLIPNLADCEFYQPGSPVRKTSDTPFYLGYFGAIGKANRLDFLLDIARACQDRNLNQVKILVAGQGAEVPRLRQKAEDLGLKNLTWIGYLNRHQVRDFLQALHATYTSFDRHPVLETNSPNKFFDSLAAGKLTIVNTRGWLQELVEQHKCGFYADPEDPADFIRHLQPYLEHPDLLHHAQEHARALAQNQFARSVLTRQFLALFPASPEKPAT